MKTVPIVSLVGAAGMLCAMFMSIKYHVDVRRYFNRLWVSRGDTSLFAVSRIAVIYMPLLVFLGWGTWGFGAWVAHAKVVAALCRK